MLRANSQAISSTPTSATSPLIKTSRRAPETTASSRCVVSETRTMPSECRTATYSSSSPADALCRSDAPVPVARAAMTSGRVE